MPDSRTTPHPDPSAPAAAVGPHDLEEGQHYRVAGPNLLAAIII